MIFLGEMELDVRHGWQTRGRTPLRRATPPNHTTGNSCCFRLVTSASTTTVPSSVRYSKARSFVSPALESSGGRDSPVRSPALRRLEVHPNVLPIRFGGKTLMSVRGDTRHEELLYVYVLQGIAIAG